MFDDSIEKPGDSFGDSCEEQEIEEPSVLVSGKDSGSLNNSQYFDDKKEEKFYCDVEDCDFRYFFFKQDFTLHGIFRTKSTSHLKLHKKSVHEGIKHQCDLCERSYNFPGDLRRHKKTTHEGLRYSCHFCDFTASQTQTLKNHVTKHHAPDNF